MSGNISVTSLNGTNGFVIQGVGISEAVDGAGDVNGDGIADMIVGAPRFTHPGAQIGSGGAAYVIYGMQGIGASGVFRVSTLNGINGYGLIGLGGETVGYSVSGAGDINDDGRGDIIIGAPLADPNGLFNAGSSYVVFQQPEETTPPTVAATVTPVAPDGANGWYHSDISVTWSFDDPETFFTVDSGCVDQTVNADTNGTPVFDCVVTSAGGTTSESVGPFKRDATLPTATINIPPEGAQYVINQAVIADWTASDATSGIDDAATAGSSPNGASVDTSTSGPHTFTVTATDFAGNQFEVTHNYTVVDPVEAVQGIIASVQALGLPAGIETSLIAKLEGAIFGFENDNLTQALAKLNEFISQVEAQRDKKISNADADALIAAAQAIIAAVS